MVPQTKVLYQRVSGGKKRSCRTVADPTLSGALFRARPPCHLLPPAAAGLQRRRDEHRFVKSARNRSQLNGVQETNRRSVWTTRRQCSLPYAAKTGGHEHRKWHTLGGGSRAGGPGAGAIRPWSMAMSLALADALRCFWSTSPSGAPAAAGGDGSPIAALQSPSPPPPPLPPLDVEIVADIDWARRTFGRRLTGAGLGGDFAAISFCRPEAPIPIWTQRSPDFGQTKPNVRYGQSARGIEQRDVAMMW